MRYALSLALFSFVANGSVSVAQNTTVVMNALANTLLIETVNGQGTGFTVDVKGRQYLVTARHLVENMGPEGEVKIAKFDPAGQIADEKYAMKIFQAEGAADIAVLIPPARLTSGESMVGCGYQLGQNAYFVGFPGGEYSDPRNKGVSLSARPMGLIKQGLLSGLQNEDRATLLLLDGMNVGGLSGSPVTYWVDAKGDDPSHTCVIAVVSGFTENLGLVLVPRVIKEQDIRPTDYEKGLIVTFPDHPGKKYRLEEPTVKGVKTKEMVQLNTGIVRTYSFGAAVKLIQDHPIGAPVP